jgi:hypothetical protein
LLHKTFLQEACALAAVVADDLGAAVLLPEAVVIDADLGLFCVVILGAAVVIDTCEADVVALVWSTSLELS